MLSFEELSGQSVHIARLHQEFVQKKNVHAYLFTGPKGTGKTSAARLCAMTAVCRGENKPCGVCGPCRRVCSGSHPDVHEIMPPKDKQIISVDQIRAMQAETTIHAFEDGAKAILFPQAERMNAAAQNCLLKTLEEPPANTVFFLITDKPDALLKTIVSRCRTVRFQPLCVEDAAKRLVQLGEPEQLAMRKARMAEGCVGQALAIDEDQLTLRSELTRDVFSCRRTGDVLAVVNRYKENKRRGGQVLDVLECAARDILQAQAGGAALETAGYDAQVQAYASAVPISGTLALMEAIRQARRMSASNVSLASALETILLKLSEEYAQWPW